MGGPPHAFIDLDRPGVWLDIAVEGDCGAVVRAVLYDDESDEEYAAQISGRLGVPVEPG